MPNYRDLFGDKGAVVNIVSGNLSEKFGAPPFSVFDARAGWWQARKAAWIAIGIQSELGRGENLLRFSDTVLEPDPAKRAAANKVASFRDQDKLGAIMRDKRGGRVQSAQEKAERSITLGQGRLGNGAGSAYASQRKGKRITAIPGGGTGKNSAYLFRTKDGYKAVNKDQTPSLKGGLVFNLTMHAYDGTDPQTTASASGTSIFDPTLCELFYRWFVPAEGLIVDPFAGGSVRGIVASRLGYAYLGIDLRKEQVEANREQAKKVCTQPQPKWHIGNSLELATWVKPASADAIWSCPPYFNLEQYSDDPEDLSNMSYDEFMDSYDKIIAGAAASLKQDRFAGWVIGEVRGEDGFCRGLVPETIFLFEKHGLRLYNDAILLTATGSLAIRAGRVFKANKKLGRTHQHVLIFVKGSAEKASAVVGNNIDIGLR